MHDEHQRQLAGSVRPYHHRFEFCRTAACQFYRNERGFACEPREHVVIRERRAAKEGEKPQNRKGSEHGASDTRHAYFRYGPFRRWTFAAAMSVNGRLTEPKASARLGGGAFRSCLLFDQ